jgi:hypothetical protein
MGVDKQKDAFTTLMQQRPIALTQEAEEVIGARVKLTSKGRMDFIEGLFKHHRETLAR